MRRFAGLLAFIVLAACGGLADTTTTPELLDPFGPPVGVNVVARDFGFSPTTWAVPSNALVVVDLDNQGSVPHTWVLVDGRATVAAAAGLDAVGIVFELGAEPGEVASGTFLAPSQPGVYQVVCRVPGHIEQGMVAELVVEP